MLGLPLGSWMRFFSVALATGVLLLFVRFGPIVALAAAVIVLALMGLVLVTLYTRSYAPPVWRRWRVSVRRARRSFARTG